MKTILVVLNSYLIFEVFLCFECFWICMFFRSETDLEDFQRSLLGSLLIFNALKASWKFSGRLLAESSPMSLFHNRYECLDKFLCLIFLHLVTSDCLKFLPFSQIKNFQPLLNLLKLENTKIYINLSFFISCHSY